MLKTSAKLNNRILFLILFLSILPIIHIGSFSMPVLYLLIPIVTAILFLITYRHIKQFGWASIPKVVKLITFLFLLIIVEIFISSILSAVTTLDKFIFPTDTIQYVARFIFFIGFIYFFYKGKIEADTFIKYFLIFLSAAMLIGILQWIPWPGRELFIKLYPYRTGLEQLERLGLPLHQLRVHGIAQIATANGGLATLFFIFGFSVFKYYKKYNILSVSLMVLSLVNVFASQARAGLLALLFSLILFYIISIIMNGNIYKKTLYLVYSVVMGIVIFVFLYLIKNPFVEHMVYRWEVLVETGGGPRVDQMKYFFSMLEHPFHYLFGLSKQVINQSEFSYGVEVEPINIFITYGAFGFMIQYTLVAVLLIYFFKAIGKSIENKAALTLIVASFVGLFSYQIFSIAYFFFREIRIGLFPWILMGVAIGVYERYKIKENEFGLKE
ncbi:hypothetical protein [Mesobacillus jeotgali]|uniref:hypothetical protein n=1 Tax=Mesobacillus jeotgali TaxID=129985 RepID=UPI001CFD2CDE|nr:hypothetical protein [Mesobacillus jeotgali]